MLSGSKKGSGNDWECFFAEAGSRGVGLGRLPSELTDLVGKRVHDADRSPREKRKSLPLDRVLTGKKQGVSERTGKFFGGAGSARTHHPPSPGCTRVLCCPANFDCCVVRCVGKYGAVHRTRRGADGWASPRSTRKAWDAGWARNGAKRPGQRAAPDGMGGSTEK